MKAELFAIIISAAIMYDFYHGNIYSKKIAELKKYFQMGMVGISVFSVYLLFKRQPKSMFNLITSINDVVIKMPLSKKHHSMTENYPPSRLVPNISPNIPHPTPNIPQNSASNFAKHSKTTKRSVSETKKKYVAASQGWKCGKCSRILNAWFEVDHHVRLEHGGSNEASNLVAMCRECHGEKTALENM
jgi:5-methylcytosine-specific restriction endonuclease McrA